MTQSQAMAGLISLYSLKQFILLIKKDLQKTDLVTVTCNGADTGCSRLVQLLLGIAF